MRMQIREYSAGVDIRARTRRVIAAARLEVNSRIRWKVGKFGEGKLTPIESPPKSCKIERSSSMGSIFAVRPGNQFYPTFFLTFYFITLRPNVIFVKLSCLLEVRNLLWKYLNIYRWIREALHVEEY